MIVHRFNQELPVKWKEEKGAWFASWLFRLEHLLSVSFSVKTFYYHFISNLIHVPYSLKNRRCILSCFYFFVNVHVLFLLLFLNQIISCCELSVCLLFCWVWSLGCIPLFYISDNDLVQSKSPHHVLLNIDLLFKVFFGRAKIERHYYRILKLVITSCSVLSLNNKLMVDLITAFLSKTSDWLKNCVHQLHIQWRRQKAAESLVLQLLFFFCKSLGIHIKITVVLVIFY